MARIVQIGRPTKLTEEVANRIVAAIARGLNRQRCADLASISERQLKEWLARGRRESKRLDLGKKPIERETIYFDFETRVREAEGQYHLQAVGVVSDAIAGNLPPRKLIKRTEKPDGNGGKLVETSTTLETSAPCWQAAIRFLAAKYPEIYGSSKNQIKDLKAMISDLLVRIAQLEGQRVAGNPPGVERGEKKTKSTSDRKQT